MCDRDLVKANFPIVRIPNTHQMLRNGSQKGVVRKVAPITLSYQSFRENHSPAEFRRRLSEFRSFDRISTPCSAGLHAFQDTATVHCYTDTSALTSRSPIKIMMRNLLASLRSGAAVITYSRTPTMSRGFAIASRLSSSSNPFANAPAPPRLPKEEQEIFEQLQRQSTGAFSTPRTPPQINQSPQSESSPKVNAEGEELHPNVRMGAKPEFEGDTNPKTGEVGGPKNEPLRWGAAGDWSYNGRVTDF